MTHKSLQQMPPPKKIIAKIFANLLANLVFLFTKKHLGVLKIIDNVVCHQPPPPAGAMEEDWVPAEQGVYLKAGGGDGVCTG